jgi:hypothetical protein
MDVIKQRIRQFEKVSGGKKQLDLRREVNKLIRLRGGNRNDVVPDVTECEHIIIGGGISGLKIASEVDGCILLERSSRLGGRVKTIKDDDAGVLFEAGPWRVHESHTRVLRLLNLDDKMKHLIPFKPPVSNLPDEMKSMTLFAVVSKGPRRGNRK